MKKYAIRFLKQGLIEIETDVMSIGEIIKLGKEALDNMSDQDLIMAMSDCTPSGINPTRFDADSFQVEAVAYVENDYTLLWTSRLWREYIND